MTNERRPPLPHIPPERKIERGRRRELAGLWLLRLGLPDDPDRVEELARVVGRYTRGTVMGDIADELVVAGQVPYADVVARRFLTISGPSRSPSRLPDGLDEGRAREVARWVYGYRAEHGVGPLWREVGAQFGWDRPTTARMLGDLRRRGYLAYLAKDRSLTAREDGALYAQPCPPPRPAKRRARRQHAQPRAVDDPAQVRRREVIRAHRQEYLRLLEAEFAEAGLPLVSAMPVPPRRESWQWALARGIVHNSPVAEALLCVSVEEFLRIVVADLGDSEPEPGLREPAVIPRWRAALDSVEERLPARGSSPETEHQRKQVRARHAQAKAASIRAHHQVVTAIHELNREPERNQIRARVQERLLAAHPCDRPSD